MSRLPLPKTPAELKSQIEERLQPGDGATVTFHEDRPAGCYLTVTFKKYNAAQVQEALSNKVTKKNLPRIIDPEGKDGTYGYEGSGAVVTGKSQPGGHG